MRGFFTDMSLERWVIVISLVAAIALGSVGFFRFHRERADLQAALHYDVKKLAQDIETAALNYSKLYKDADLQGLTGTQSNMESFIRDLARRETANLGQVAVTISEGNSPRKGVKDVKYGIAPQTRDRAFSRVGIGNFLYMLETEGRRLRVSHLRLQMSPRNLKEWEIPPGKEGSEQWTWEAELISRQKTEIAAK
jgi:hypothetical protein